MAIHPSIHPPIIAQEGKSGLILWGAQISVQNLMAIPSEVKTFQPGAAVDEQHSLPKNADVCSYFNFKSKPG